MKGYTYYVVEKNITGYTTTYVNVGTESKTVDKAFDGGTILNRKIPKTGDDRPVTLWAAAVLLGILGIGAVLTAENRKRRNRS